MLKGKSLTELRGIAQSLGVKEVFRLDIPHLLQAIEDKQMALIPRVQVDIPKPEYDARLMTKPPARKSKAYEIEELLAEYCKRGLQLTFDENGERWQMRCGVKTDEGTIRMPLRTVLYCANKIMG